jgi:TM2 domain-containing membrane protein YozV
MSEENKDLGDKAEDAMGKAKKKAKDLGEKASEKFDDAKESTKEFAEEAKEKASDFAEDAKDTAKEFTASAKEAFGGAGGDNKKLLAGILAIVLGALGVHKFILGYNKEGIIMLVVTIVLGFFTCGIGASLMGLLGLIEGILYLTKSDEEFYNTYQVGQKPWF